LRGDWQFLYNAGDAGQAMAPPNCPALPTFAISSIHWKPNKYPRHFLDKAFCQDRQTLPITAIPAEAGDGEEALST